MRMSMSKADIYDQMWTSPRVVSFLPVAQSVMSSHMIENSNKIVSSRFLLKPPQILVEIHWRIAWGQDEIFVHLSQLRSGS